MGKGKEYRPIAEIVEELEALEKKAKESDADRVATFKRLGVRA